MRIFCAVRHANDPKQFYGGLWSANFYPALRELGHQIVDSQVDLLPTSRFMHIADHFTAEELEVRAQTTQRTLDEVKTALQAGPLDLFLSYFYNSHFDPAGFDELRKLGVPSVNFYCNSIHQFQNVSAVAAKVDFAWHAERDARESYLAAGASPVWVQMAADPKVYRPVAGTRRRPDACFVGQRYGDRDRCLAALARSKVPLTVYGAGWGVDAPATPASEEGPDIYLGRRCVKPGSNGSYFRAIAGVLQSDGLLQASLRVLRQARLRRESQKSLELLRAHVRGRADNVSEVLASHEVCLNFSNVWADGRSCSALIPHVRLRDFEGPMCRTCYLTGHTDEITEFYDVGKEIETYRSTEELVDKARFYLSHREAAEKLREAGYRRALRDHTWKRRFEQLFIRVFSKN